MSLIKAPRHPAEVSTMLLRYVNLLASLLSSFDVNSKSEGFLFSEYFSSHSKAPHFGRPLQIIIAYYSYRRDIEVRFAAPF